MIIHHLENGTKKEQLAHTVSEMILKYGSDDTSVLYVIKDNITGNIGTGLLNLSKVDTITLIYFLITEVMPKL